MNKNKIEKYCNSCDLITEHDIEENITDDTKTIITVCRLCGETDVDVDAIDIYDILPSDCEECGYRESAIKLETLNRELATLTKKLLTQLKNLDIEVETTFIDDFTLINTVSEIEKILVNVEGVE